MKANQLVKTTEQIDPFQASLECLIVIAFPKTNSKNYAFAVRIAESAERYAVADISGKSMHIAVFGKTQADAGRAATVLGYTQGGRALFYSSKEGRFGTATEFEKLLNASCNRCNAATQRRTAMR